MVAKIDNLFYIISYAVTAYLNKQYRLSIAIINSYLEYCPIPSEIDSQYSEVLLFKVRVQMDAKMNQEALKFLNSVKKVNLLILLDFSSFVIRLKSVKDYVNFILV